MEKIGDSLFGPRNLVTKVNSPQSATNMAASTPSGPQMADGIQDEQRLTPAPNMDSPPPAPSRVNVPLGNKPPITDNMNEPVQDDQIRKPVDPNAPKEPKLRMATEEEIRDGSKGLAYIWSIYGAAAFGIPSELVPVFWTGLRRS